MTELNQAYGDFEEETYAPTNNHFEEKPEEKPVMKLKLNTQPKEQHNYVPKPEYPMQEYALPQQNAQVQNTQRRNPTYSFWDRMAMKRPDVIKLVIFSLVIVLAISIYKLGTHYMTKYITDNVLTDFQEFMVRLAYPVLVFLILWMAKSM
jgi:ABC-type bacteriocin/lantibiotic exporter with double-glycine peptidase domain